MAARDNTGLLIVLALAGIYLAYGGVTGDWGLAIVTGSFPSNWLSYGSAYTPYINSIESQYGLPQNLLCAVAYQESSFNPSAVNASSGATGMFQLMPAYYPNAGQSWQTDATTAAQALAGYYQTYGDWQMALAAYNWGPGNLNAAGTSVTYSQLPSETQGYVANISDALGLSGTLVQAS